MNKLKMVENEISLLNEQEIFENGLEFMEQWKIPYLLQKMLQNGLNMIYRLSIK